MPSKILCQIGWQRNLLEGQKIEIYYNSNLLQMKNGDYLTSKAQRNHSMWYMCNIDGQTGDNIYIKSSVGLRCLGEDENRSFEAIFSVDENLPEISFSFPKVGYGHNFPILKGKLNQISLLTSKDKRLMSIRSKLNISE
jgi:hypothetical protein